MINNDFYGDRNKWFVGVVKDVSDPRSSNRVRVRIFGIHPDEGDSEQVNMSGGTNGSGSGSTGSGSGSTGSGSGGSTGSGSGGSTGSGSPSSSRSNNNEAYIPPPTGTGGSVVEPEDVASPRNMTGPIARGSITTLHDLTKEPHGQLGIRNGQLTQQVVRNLARISINLLDKLRRQYGPRLIIKSGFRGTGGTVSAVNHGQGYAIDIVVKEMTYVQLRDAIAAQYKGFYTMILSEKDHVHIQLGGASFQGSTSKPVVKAWP